MSSENPISEKYSSDGYYSDSEDGELAKRMFEPGQIEDREVRKFLIDVQRERRSILHQNTDCIADENDKNKMKKKSEPNLEHRIHKDDSNLHSLFIEADELYLAYENDLQSNQDNIKSCESEKSEDLDESKNFSTDLYAMSSNLAELVFGDLESTSFRLFKKKTLNEFHKLRKILNLQPQHNVTKTTNPNPDLYQRKHFISNFKKLDDEGKLLDNIVLPKQSIITKFDQIMCSRCLVWMTNYIDFDKQENLSFDGHQCLWVYSILARLQKPVLSHTQSYISTILYQILKTRSFIKNYDELKSHNVLLLIIIYCFDLNFVRIIKD